MRRTSLRTSFGSLSVIAIVSLSITTAIRPVAAQSDAPADGGSSISMSAPTMTPEAPAGLADSDVTPHTAHHRRSHRSGESNSSASESRRREAASSGTDDTQAAAKALHAAHLHKLHLAKLAAIKASKAAGATVTVQSAPAVAPARTAQAPPSIRTPAASVSSPLDSMTRDGATASSNNDASGDLGAQNLNVGVAIARTLAALAIVLAMIYGVIRFLRKKGRGVPKQVVDGADDLEESPSGLSAGLAQQRGSSWTPLSDLIQQRQEEYRKLHVGDTPGYIPAGSRSAVDAIADMEFLGSEPLPNSGHVLYKVRVGDRILLLGGAPSGTLTALTEWDVETRPETEQRFEEMLNHMTMTSSSGAGTGDAVGSAGTGAVLADQSAQAAELQNAAERITAAVRRASGG